LSPTRSERTDDYLHESPSPLKRQGIRRVVSLEDTTQRNLFNNRGLKDDIYESSKLHRGKVKNQSQSMTTLNDKKFNKKTNRRVHKDPYNEDLIEIFTESDSIMQSSTYKELQDDESDEVDNDMVFPDVRYKKFYEPVLRNQNRHGIPKIQKVPVRRVDPSEKMRNSSKIRVNNDSEDVLYPATASTRADRDKIKELEERLERIEKQKLNELEKLRMQSNKPGKAIASVKKNIKSDQGKEKIDKPSPFIAHIPKYGRQLPLPEDKKKNRNKYMLPKIVSDDEDESSTASNDRIAAKVKRSEQIEKDVLRGKPKNVYKEVQAPQKLPHLVKNDGKSAGKKDEMRHRSAAELEVIKRKAKERALQSAGVDFSDSEIKDAIVNHSNLKQMIDHANLKEKVSQLESRLRSQREIMEDYPGEVTADAEAGARALEREVRAMRVEIDVTEYKSNKLNPQGEIAHADAVLMKKSSPMKAIATNVALSDKVPTPRAVSETMEIVSKNLSPSTSTLDNVYGGKFQKGDSIESKHAGLDALHRGVIHRYCGDGTYDLKYDNGQTEENVKESFIRKLAAQKLSFSVGASVEARYDGQEAWYPGKVAVDRGDGTYDIQYDDGDSEIRVRAELIRSLSKAVLSLQPSGVGASSVSSKSNADNEYVGDDFEDEISTPIAAKVLQSNVPHVNSISPHGNSIDSQPTTSVVKVQQLSTKNGHNNDGEEDEGDNYGDEDFEDDDFENHES